MSQPTPVNTKCRQCGTSVAVIIGGLALSGEEFSGILKQLRERGQQPTFADSEGRYVCPNCSAVGNAHA